MLKRQAGMRKVLDWRRGVREWTRRNVVSWMDDIMEIVAGVWYQILGVDVVVINLEVSI